MPDQPPVLMWFRRDLRLGDNPALTAAVASGAPVIPVFILDEVTEAQGAAPRFRLGKSVAALAQSLRDKGSRLILRRGRALDTLRQLVSETGARAVHWSRAYDPAAKERDIAVKAALKQDGLTAQSHPGHLMFEPWTVETGTGGFYKVYTPMWKAVRGRDVAAPLATPGGIPAPEAWPASESEEDWALGTDMRRGADIVAGHMAVGEEAASHRLAAFMGHKVAEYDSARDIPGIPGTSRLSENLTYGEISPRSCWHAGQRAMAEGKAGAETFLKELVWREFAYHLVHHTPQITCRNWKPDWDAFPWNEDEDRPEILAWKQGRTGIEFVDAAMREMHVTGTMHNRGRMIVASYLTKHLLSHWKIGLRWFEEHLIDWDPASNAMGWQWSAGSGPDATPYFRVFNPVTQLDKFDRSRAYVRAWIAEGQGRPPQTALDYFEVIPASWGLSASMAYPDPVVTPEQGRRRALDAYEARSF